MESHILLWAVVAMLIAALVIYLIPRSIRDIIDITPLEALARLYPSARVFADADAIEKLQDRLLELNEQAESIQASADAEQRELSEDEQTQIDSIFGEFKTVEQDIARRERIEAQSRKLAERMGRRTEPNNVDNNGNPIDDGADDNTDPAAARRTALMRANPTLAPRITSRDMRDPNGRRWGWQNLGQFARAVHSASRSGGHVDPRLVQNAPTTFGQEGVGADGGFLVPPEFRQSILEKVMGEESLLMRTDQLTSSSNTVILPTDQVTPWDTTNGIQAYWEGEASQLTQSKFQLKSETYRLNKLTALIPVTEELLEDAPATDTYLRRKAPEKFTSKINTALIRGTGAGMPQGILNANALVTVSKEAGQSADTVVMENVSKMWSRLYAPCRRRAVWLINQDIEHQLHTLKLEGTSSGVFPVYLPPGGLSQSPFGQLFGRPVLPAEDCSTLGDLGDIILADLQQYLTVMKTIGVRADVSMHLWFDYDVLAYRFIIRLAGAPWWNSAITPKQGSNTRSCFVTLAERA